MNPDGRAVVRCAKHGLLVDPTDPSLTVRRIEEPRGPTHQRYYCSERTEHLEG